MKIMKKLKIITLLTLLTLFSGSILAKNFSLDSNIVILKSLDLVELEKMNFGTIEVPTQDIIVHIKTDGKIGDKNTASYLDQSSISAGKYKIFGSNNSAINISARNGGRVPNMSFKKIDAIYQNQSGELIDEGLSNLDAPTTQGSELTIGGSLEVKSGVVEGSYSPDFILEISYE